MAIKFAQEKKKQKYLILIFIVIMIVIGIIWWFAFFKEKFKPVSPTVTTIFFREIKINFELLESEQMRKLQSFKEIIPFSGKPGRENPFLPY